MIRSLIFPVLLGAVGTAILVALGVWQIQRLEWKKGVIAEAEAQLAAPPVALPADPAEEAHEYLAVTVTGTATGEELHVLTSGTAAGTGYRVISAFETADHGRIMVDHGLLRLDDKALPPQTDTTQIIGNLLWPDDRTSSTPAPDLANNIWFARDVAPMAEALGTRPVMVIARTASQPDPRLTPLPIDTANIRNDHLGYVITWFGLAIVWLGMTGLMIRRITRRTD